MAERKVVDGYIQALVDADGDWIGIDKDGRDTVYLRTRGSSVEGATVRVYKNQIPELLRAIAEISGVEVLILARPNGLAAPRKLNVSANPEVSGRIQLDVNFNYSERLSPNQTAELIWDLATAAAKAQTRVDETEVAALAEVLPLNSLNSFQALQVARDVVKLGYRKDPSKRVAEEGIHGFNSLPEVAGS